MDTAGRHLRDLLAAMRSDAFSDAGRDSPKGVDPLRSTRRLRGGTPSATPPDVSVPSPGTIIRGTWELSALLGKGGFGLVYSAHNHALDREDAVKFLHPHLADDREFRSRFEREAKAMARVRGDHFLVVHDYGEHEGLPFFAMERLHGETLQERLDREAPLPLEEIFPLAVGILRGLAEVHAHGIVHRDIKPANIFVVADTGRVKLLDFGLAMTSVRLTSKGVIMGTPLYMAPELLLSPKATASVATDIYSAGVVIYQMLMGRVPFRPNDSGNIADFLQQVITAAPHPPSLDRPEIPEVLEDLVLRAIDKDPERRPTDAGVLADVLEDVVSNSQFGPLSSAELESSIVTKDASQASSPRSAATWTRPRARGIAILGLAVAVLTMLAVPSVLWPWSSAPELTEAGSILVTSTSWGSSEVTEWYEALCASLHEQAPRRVDCAQVSRWRTEPTRYRAWALESGAAMAIHVEDERSARIVLSESLSSIPLFRDLPGLELRDVERIRRIAPLLALLPRAADEVLLDVPSLDPDEVGYEWATMAALLRRLHAGGSSRDALPRLRKLARCDGARVGVEEDERMCDIARYLQVSAEVSSSTCDRLMPELRVLKDSASRVVQIMARLKLAECTVMEAPEEAAVLALEALDSSPLAEGCELLGVLPFAPYLAGSSNAERQLLARIEALDLQQCYAPGAAHAVARRGVVRREQKRWLEAAADFYQAYRLVPDHREYLAMWAEARLREPLDTQTRRRLLDELRPDLFGAEQHMAMTLAYLRWLVTRAAVDGDEVLQRYDAVPAGKRPLPDGACDGLRELACTSEEGPCTLDLLHRTKAAGQRTELEAALRASNNAQSG